MNEQPPLPDEATPVVVARPVAYAPLAPLPNEMEMRGISRGDAALDLMVVVLASIVLPNLPGLLVPFSMGESAMPEIGAGIIAQKWCEAALAVGLLIYFVFRHRISPAAFGLRGNRLGHQLLWAVAAAVGVYVALIASSAIVIPLFFLVPGFEGDLAERVEFVEAMPVHNLAKTLVLLVAVAAHEEALFRGLLLPYLRRISGSWWWAGLISALIFALLHVPHQGILAGIQVFSIAAVLSLFFVLSRSLIAVALAHLTFDFLQFQLVRIMPNLKDLLDQVQG
jgi:membrane protease YdiL (CAAX protease family)